MRSYVLRQGRISTAQVRALETLAAQYCIPYSRTLLDLADRFGRHAPVTLEIGFGMGETTVAIAQTHPERNYVGVEVHAPGVGSLLKRVAELDLKNVRVIQHDAVEVIESMIAPESLNAVHVFFPDPWPKQRHHKRRLIQTPFVALLASRIAPGGDLHLATDWADYAQQMLTVLSAEALLRNTGVGFTTRPAHRPVTKFEQRAARLGHEVHDLLFRRVVPVEAGG